MLLASNTRIGAFLAVQRAPILVLDANNTTHTINGGCAGGTGVQTRLADQIVSIVAIGALVPALVGGG